MLTAKLFAADPELLTFKELVTLSQTDRPTGPLKQKLSSLLSTPFIQAALESGASPRRPRVEGLGPVARAAEWNIERGLNFDLIRLAFSDPEGFERAAFEHNPVDPDRRAQIEAQLRTLQDVDIIVLNEADLGMKRTGYRDVTRELAQALKMNFVFGVEFVEVDPLVDLGLEKAQLDESELSRKMQAELHPDPERYRGLHGNAILSRYPISNARILRLPVCHDWYNTERAEISKIEQSKRLGANLIFLERIEREVRQGGRMAVLADVEIPGLQGGKATVVSVHLENKCKPGCRREQMDALLSQLSNIKNPVILAGDLNTTGTDGTPTSIRHELMTRITDYQFWIGQALRWVTPVSLPLTLAGPINYFKNYLDPTASHIPVIGSNKESKLFTRVEQFRFSDDGAFDFRGEPERNLHNKSRTLANSNQRAFKGFVPSYSAKRDFGGLIGRFKLDWFFIKPLVTDTPGSSLSSQFAPHFPLTMRDLNDAVPDDGISDHAPMTVDLPIGEAPAAGSAVPCRVCTTTH